MKVVEKSSKDDEIKSVKNTILALEFLKKNMGELKFPISEIELAWNCMNFINAGLKDMDNKIKGLENGQ
jgi:hypothetical protein